MVVGGLEEVWAQLRVFGAMATQVARHEVRIEGAMDDIDAIHQANRDTVAEIKHLLAGLRDTSEKGTQRVEAKIDKYIELQEKRESERTKHMWQFATVIGGAIVAAAGGIIAAGVPGT